MFLGHVDSQSVKGAAMQLLVQRLLGLGLLAAAAHAALPAVDTSLPVGAECMSDYLATVLQPPNNSLIIDGDVTLVATYLRDLAPGTPKVLSPTDEDLTVSRLRQTLTMSRTLILVVERSGNELLDFLLKKPTVLKHTQVLLWTWAQSPHDVLALTRSGHMWICNIHLNLAVSTPDGTTFLYNAAELSCQRRWQDIKMQESGKCSSGLFSWPKESLPELMCLDWKPRGSEKSPVRVIAFAPPLELRVAGRPYEKLIENLVASVRPAVELAWMPHNRTIHGQVFANTVNCNIAALITFFPMTVRVEPHLNFEGLVLVQAVVVVPTGLGPHPGLLKAVTAEFSVALWVATALALGCMTAALAVASACLGRARLTALAAAPLQALAPLLAQAPPGRTAHRPLSAVWLLMSVVLAAAYQGLLLRELTSPPGEINTLEQLEQSGLDVLIVEELHITRNNLPTPITSRAHYIPQDDLNVATKNTSEGRKSAIICFLHISEIYRLTPLLHTPSKRLHMFKLPYYSVKAFNLFNKGSPIREQLKSAIAHAEGGGLFLHYNDEILSKLRPSERVRVSDPSGQLTRPLSLDQLLPAFVVLGAGHCLGALVFALELLCRKWAEHRAPPVRIFLL